MKQTLKSLKTLDYNHIFFFLMGLSNLFFIILLILLFANTLPSFWHDNLLYFFCAIAAINTIYLATEVKKIPEEERDKSTIVYLSKYLFILLLILIAANQFLKRQIIIDLLPYITAITIACGFLTFYAHKNRVEKELEDEKTNEDNAEAKRLKEFDKRFPRIAKLNLAYGFHNALTDYKGIKRILLFIVCIFTAPFIFFIRLPYKLIRWMYKMGWKFSIPFIIITIAFITIKIGMPIVYTGSYIDEYNHILSGIEFFKTGHFAEIYKGEYYNRGAYVSFLVGLYFKLFGQTIFVAKMVPATIGIIDFFLLFAIARNIIERKHYINLLMIIYTISPWIIFNHFYIRFYVFYELFLLTSSYLFFRLYSKSLKINERNFFIFLLLFLAFLLISSNDSGIIFILLFLAFMGSYFFIERLNLKKNNKSPFYLNNKKFKLIILVIIFSITFIFLDGFSLINEFFTGRAPFTSIIELKYNYFFFSLNTLFTIFFILSTKLLFFNKISTFEKLFFISLLLILFLHYISSLDFQMTRVVLYFFPLFYLFSIKMVYISKIIYKIKIELIIILFLIITIFLNYPTDFINHPYIPSEINYLDQQFYQDIKAECEGAIIITASYPPLLLFHGIKPDYFLNLRIEESPENYYIIDGKIKEVYSKVEIIGLSNGFFNVLDTNQKICFFGGELSENNVGFLIFDYANKNMIKENKEYESTRPIFFYKMP